MPQQLFCLMTKMSVLVEGYFYPIAQSQLNLKKFTKKVIIIIIIETPIWWRPFFLKKMLD